LSLALYERGARLSSANFEKVLASFNIFPSKVHLQTLIKSFGGDCLDVDCFMGALRPSLNSRRSAIVKAAWDRIAEGKDCVSLDRMSECYDVSRNGDFIEGTATKE